MNRMEAQSEAAQPVPWEVDVVCYADIAPTFRSVGQQSASHSFLLRWVSRQAVEYGTHTFGCTH